MRLGEGCLARLLLWPSPATTARAGGMTGTLPPRLSSCLLNGDPRRPRERILVVTLTGAVNGCEPPVDIVRLRQGVLGEEGKGSP